MPPVSPAGAAASLRGCRRAGGGLRAAGCCCRGAPGMGTPGVEELGLFPPFILVFSVFQAAPARVETTANVKTANAHRAKKVRQPPSPSEVRNTQCFFFSTTHLHSHHIRSGSGIPFPDTTLFFFFFFWFSEDGRVALPICDKHNPNPDIPEAWHSVMPCRGEPALGCTLLALCLLHTHSGWARGCWGVCMGNGAWERYPRREGTLPNEAGDDAQPSQHQCREGGDGNPASQNIPSPPKCLFSPQAAAPAALQDVPSVHRAASAKGPPPPSAAAASSSPRTTLTGGQRGKLTLLYVFFLYVRSDSVSVRHVWCATRCLNKAVCI